MRRTYQQLATELGVRFCFGITPTGLYCEHEHTRQGSWSPGVIHMVDGRVSKPGLARFLRLAAQAQAPQLFEHEPEWRRVYFLHRYSRMLAGRLHVRMPPRAIYDFDRAFVLAATAGMPNSVPYRFQAHEWARR